MKKRNILMLLTGILLLAGGALTMHQKLFAKDFGHGDGHEHFHHMMMQLFMHSSGNPEMKQELITYFKDNMYPAMKEERGKLEEKLTEEEKQTIREVRSAIAVKHPDIARLMQHMHKDEQLSDKDKESAQALHSELMQMTAPLLKISEKYSDEMKDIHNRLGANAEEWHKGLKSIMDKWPGDKMEQENHADMHHSLHRHFKAMHGDDHPDMGHMMTVHFLLLDPNAASMEDFFPGFSLHAAGNDQHTINAAGLKLYPNPAQNNSVIEFVAEKDENVVIDISDKEGRSVKTLLNESRAKGTYRLNVDLSKYKEGAYYIRCINGQNTVSKTLLKY